MTDSTESSLAGDRRSVETVSLLARLVAARSPNPPGDERAVAELIATIAGELGLRPGHTYAAEAARPNRRGPALEPSAPCG